MAYIYSNPMAEAATMGAATGQSLAQGMYGVPMQRAEMAMRLMELQRQAAQMQQMGQYRQGMLQMQNQRLQDQNAWHKSDEDRKTQYGQLEQQYHQGQLQNQTLANQLRMLAQQSAQQRFLAPRVQDGQLIQGQQQPQGLPGGDVGPSMEQAGMAPPTGPVNWSVTPVGAKPQPEFPPALLTALSGLSRDYMGSLGSTNTALQDFGRTNTLPLLQRLQQRAMGQPTQQALTNAPVQQATAPGTNQVTSRFTWDGNQLVPQ
jgi:hypothetical protein